RRGSVDGLVFGPLLGTLKILQKSSADPNPFEVQCMTNSLQDVGNLSWLSFVQIENGQGEVISRVTLTSHGEAHLEVEKRQSPLSPSWSTISKDEWLEG